MKAGHSIGCVCAFVYKSNIDCHTEKSEHLRILLLGDPEGSLGASTIILGKKKPGSKTLWWTQQQELGLGPRTPQLIPVFFFIMKFWRPCLFMPSFIFVQKNSKDKANETHRFRTTKSPFVLCSDNTLWSPFGEWQHLHWTAWRGDPSGKGWPLNPHQVNQAFLLQATSSMSGLSQRLKNDTKTVDNSCCLHYGDKLVLLLPCLTLALSLFQLGVQLHDFPVKCLGAEVSQIHFYSVTTYTPLIAK